MVLSTQNDSYWETLTNNAPTQTKIWLEGYDIQDINQVSQYHFELITLPKNYDIHLLQCAWGLLINRFCSSNDILYGTGILGTHYFPVRCTLKNKQTLGEFLKKQSEQLEQSKLNFNLLNIASVETLFHYLLLIHSDLNIVADQIHLDPEKYPLILIYCPTQSNKMLIGYNQKKYTPTSCHNLIEHLFIILEKIITEPDQPVTQFSILTSDDKHKINSWGKAYTTHSHLFKNIFIDDIFCQHAKNIPHHTAIVWHNKIMNYGELNQLVNKIILLLHEKNIHAGNNIAVFMERSPELIAVMLAIFKLDAIFVPINPKYPEDRIQFILEDCQAPIIIVDQTDTIPKQSLYKTINIHEQLANMNTFSNYQQPKMIQKKDLNQLAYIVYTSGTTGQPKGVMIRHVSLTNLSEWYQICFQLNAEDRLSQFNSLGFDAFFCEIIPALAVGASIYIIDDPIKLTPYLFFDWLVEQKITVCDLPTAYAQVLFNLPWPTHLNLRLLKIGGESLTQYPKQLFPFDVWNIYGPTEVTIEATYMKIIEANKPPEQQTCQHLPPPIGKPLLNSICYLVDSHLNLVPPGCAGELLIGGINLSTGYLNHTQLTKEKFIQNIFDENEIIFNKLYRSGDLARWLPDGNLEFLGRIDHQIKIRGYRIELNEIEAALSQYTDVNEVIVLAKENNLGGKSLNAWLVPNFESLRIPFQEHCLISLDNSEYFQVFTEDFSKAGIGINGYNHPIDTDKKIQINIKLPGASDSQWLTGKVIWQKENRLGIHFDQTAKQKNLLEKSIEYYLSTHNLMETLQSASVKRNLKLALKKKLPEYMIPDSFNILPKMPLTFNGKIDIKALPPPQNFNKLLERKYVEPRNKTEKIIKKIWEKILDQDNISITDNFFDLGGSSLSASKVLVELMNQFQLPIPANIFLDLPFIPIMAEYIDSKGQKYTKKTEVQDEINRDIILNDDILPHKKISDNINKPQNILLTGAGGFLGLFILSELIKQTEAKIYCLIRPGGFDSIASRLNNQIEFFQLADELSLSNRRIVLISGDIGLYQFNIPSELYKMLTEKIDCIYHCGAQVNTMAAYTALRTSNVQGTREIIQFATQVFDKPIYYISTLSAAFEKDEAGHYVEVFPGTQTDQLSGGYAISKWVSERLLTQLMHRGLPVQIYRSGYIGGTSKTGIANHNDALLLLIKGCIQLGFAPNWTEKITVLPVDFVSEAIVKISLHQPDKSGVFHIDHPTGILWTDLIHWLNQRNYTIQICSHTEWLEHLSHITQENVLFPFLPYYLAMKNPPNTPETNMEHAKTVLNQLGLAYPQIDDKMLNTYFNYLEACGFLPTKNTITKAERA